MVVILYHKKNSSWIAEYELEQKNGASRNTHKYPRAFIKDHWITMEEFIEMQVLACKFELVLFTSISALPNGRSQRVPGIRGKKTLKITIYAPLYGVYFMFACYL